MAGTRPSRRERLGAAALAALLALSVVAGVTGLGAAHDDTEHITRNGDHLVVTLGDQHGVNETKQITVSVAGETYTHSPKKNATDTFKFRVKDISTPKKDLKNVTVTVKSNGTELFNETEDLRYLKFGNTKNASFSGQKLRIPLKKALGYTDGTDVALKLGGKKKPVSGTVKYEKKSKQAFLEVSFTTDKLSLPLAKKTQLKVPNRDKTSLKLRKHVRSATVVGRLDDRTLGVTNPLFGGGSYDLVVQTSEPNGTFASTVNASDGRLTVSDQMLATAKGGTVSVYRDGKPLVENVSYSASSEKTITATVENGGSVVSLNGSSLTTKRTMVWIANGSQHTNDTRYVSVSVPVKKGNVSLKSTAYRLDPNGSYRIIVTGEEFVRATVSGDKSASDTLFYAPETNATGNATDGDGEGKDGSSSGLLGGNPLVLGGIVVGVLGLLVVGVVVGIRLSGGSSSGGGGAAGTSRGDEHTVHVDVMDAATNSFVDEATVVAKQRHGNSGREEVTLTDGTGTLTLGRGRWSIVAESNGVTEEKRTQIRTGKKLQYELGPKTAEVEVTDGDGTPLSDVTVTASSDEGATDTRRTDAKGTARFGVPLTASRVEVAADHEKYEGDAAELSLDGDSAAEESLTIRPLTGGLDVTATVDGTPVAGLSVEIQPREEAIRELGENRDVVTTDDDGVAEFDDLLVGKYEIRMEVPGGGDAFSVRSKRVRVGDGRRTRETLDASFEYSLARNQRDRIAEVRREVDALTTASGRDVAIPRYYGSVVTSLLDTIERVSREGHRFATAEADPDEVVEVLLDTAENAVELVDDAMATKRNTDLFGACVDMPDERVEWTDGFDVETLFELLAEDRKTQRQTVLTQLRSVDDRINDERSEVAVVAPARELWEGVKEFVNAERGDDPVRGAAVAFAAGGLLDAVDELFDHEELRDRLERTVF